MRDTQPNNGKGGSGSSYEISTGSPDKMQDSYGAESSTGGYSQANSGGGKPGGAPAGGYGGGGGAPAGGYGGGGQAQAMGGYGGQTQAMGGYGGKSSFHIKVMLIKKG